MQSMGMQADLCPDRENSDRNRPASVESGPDSAEMGPNPAEFGQTCPSLGRIPPSSASRDKCAQVWDIVQSRPISTRGGCCRHVEVSALGVASTLGHRRARNFPRRLLFLPPAPRRPLGCWADGGRRYTTSGLRRAGWPHRCPDWQAGQLGSWMCALWRGCAWLQCLAGDSAHTMEGGCGLLGWAPRLFGGCWWVEREGQAGRRWLGGVGRHGAFGRMAQNLARDRPTSTKPCPESAKRCPNSGRVGPMSGENGPNFGPGRVLSCGTCAPEGLSGRLSKPPRLACVDSYRVTCVGLFSDGAYCHLDSVHTCVRSVAARSVLCSAC